MTTLILPLEKTHRNGEAGEDRIDKYFKIQKKFQTLDSNGMPRSFSASFPETRIKLVNSTAATETILHLT